MRFELKALFFVLLLPLGMASCTGLSTEPPLEPHVVPEHEAEAPYEYRIYVFSEGWHTGIVVAARDVSELEWLGSLEYRSQDYLEFGWGDEAILRSEELSLALVSSALWIPTPTVVRVEWFSQQPEQRYANEQLRTYDLTQEQFSEVMAEIRSSIKDSDHLGRKEAEYVGSGDVVNSAYFRGKKHYLIGQSCNRWTSSVLRKAGFKTRAIFAPALFRQLDSREHSNQ